MAGLIDVDPYRKASDELLSLSGKNENPDMSQAETQPKAPNTGSNSLPKLYPGLPDPKPEEKGIMAEGFDAMMYSLGPQNIRLFGAGLRAIGASLQMEDLYDSGYTVEKFGEDMDFGEAATMPDIEGASSLARWIAGGLGQGLGSVAPPVVAGAAGGLAGFAAGGPAGAAAGAIGMGYAVNDILLAGEALTQFEESGVDPLSAAKAARQIAPVMAALDTIGLVKVLRGPGRKATDSLLKYVGKRMAHGASIEAATEMAQGVVREVSDAALSGDSRATERALSILEEGIVAGMTGGVLGGVAGGFTGRSSAATDPDTGDQPEEAPGDQPLLPEEPEEALLPEETIEEALPAEEVPQKPPDQPDQALGPDPEPEQSMVPVRDEKFLGKLREGMALDDAYVPMDRIERPRGIVPDTGDDAPEGEEPEQKDSLVKVSAGKRNWFTNGDVFMKSGKAPAGYQTADVKTEEDKTQQAEMGKVLESYLEQSTKAPAAEQFAVSQDQDRDVVWFKDEKDTVIGADMNDIRYVVMKKGNVEWKMVANEGAKPALVASNSSGPVAMVGFQDVNPPANVADMVTGQYQQEEPEVPGDGEPGVKELRMKLKAYKGSPRKVDRFDMSYIGSGEGQSADPENFSDMHGYGHYVASNIDVAKWYEDMLSPYSSGGTQLVTRDERRIVNQEDSLEKLLGDYTGQENVGWLLSETMKEIDTGEIPPTREALIGRIEEHMDSKASNVTKPEVRESILEEKEWLLDLLEEEVSDIAPRVKIAGEDGKPVHLPSMGDELGLQYLQEDDLRIIQRMSFSALKNLSGQELIDRLNREEIRFLDSETTGLPEEEELETRGLISEDFTKIRDALQAIPNLKATVNKPGETLEVDIDIDPETSLLQFDEEIGYHPKKVQDKLRAVAEQAAQENPDKINMVTAGDFGVLEINKESLDDRYAVTDFLDNSFDLEPHQVVAMAGPFRDIFRWIVNGHITDMDGVMKYLDDTEQTRIEVLERRFIDRPEDLRIYVEAIKRKLGKVRELLEENPLEFYTASTALSRIDQKTGREFYNNLTDTLGRQKDTSMLLAKNGIGGNSYVSKSNNLNYVIYDDDRMDIVGRHRLRPEPQSPAPKADPKFDREKVQNVVDRMTKKWDMNKIPEIEVVENPGALPEKLREALSIETGNIPDIEEVAMYAEFDNDTQKVYIFSDNVDTADDVSRAISHEVVGHFSMREMLGDEFGDILKQVNRMRGRKNMQPYFDVVDELYGAFPDDVKAEEVIAMMAETKDKNPIMTRVIAAIRRFLRKLGFKLAYTYSEIRSMIMNAGKRLDQEADPRMNVASSDPDPVYQMVPDALRFSLGAWANNQPQMRATHGLSAENLESALDRGTLIEPSVAITPTDVPHKGVPESDVELVFVEDRNITDGDAEVPMRDVATAIVPKGTPKALRDKIRKNGIQVRTKRPGMTDQALAELQSSPRNVRFKRRKATKREKQNRAKIIDPTRPAESFFRMLVWPIGGLDSEGNYKYSKKMQAATRKILMESRPNKDSSFAFLDGFIDKARYAWFNRYGTPNEFLAAERERGAISWQIMNDLIGFLERIRDADMTLQQHKALQDVLEGKELTDASMKDLAKDVRESIDQYGKQLVDLGLLDEKTWKKNFGTYLHRSYRKYEFDAPEMVKWARQRRAASRQTLHGDELKRRGLTHKFQEKRLMRDVPEELRNEAMKKPWQVFDIINEEDGKVVDRFYIPVGMEDKMKRKAQPQPGTIMKNQGKWQVRKTGRGKPVLWRDYTEDERKQNGEIRDARYNLIKTYELFAHDIATGKFFEDISKNPAWFQQDEPKSALVMSAEEAAKSFTQIADTEWIRVPDAKIAKSNVPRWGALAGGYIKAPIWRDLAELEKMQNPGVWGWLLREWKANKTARSPTVHFNNFVGNLILSELYDFTARDLARAMREYSDRGEMFQEAVKHGVFQSSFVRTELMGGHESKKIIDDIIRDVENIKDAPEGHLARTWRLISKGLEKMEEWYQYEDEIFRLVSYMSDRAYGVSPDKAAENAINRFMNYDIRAPIPNALRRTVFPFLSYTYAFVPAWLKAVSNKPWKIAKVASLGYIVMMLSEALVEGDEEKERLVMSERDTGYTWAGLPKTLRTPFESDGDPIYIGLQRLLPGGGLTDMDAGHVSGMPEWLLISGPMLMGGELFLNRLSFNGQDIVDSVDTGMEKTMKRGTYLWRGMMPNAPWVPGSYNWDMLGKAFTGQTDMFGRNYSPVIAGVRQFGPKLYPFDYDTQLAYRMMDIDKDSREYKKKLWQLTRDRNTGKISEGAYRRGVERVTTGLKRLADKASKLTGDN